MDMEFFVDVFDGDFFVRWVISFCRTQNSLNCFLHEHNVIHGALLARFAIVCCVGSSVVNFEHSFCGTKQHREDADNEIYLPFLIVIEGISIHKVDCVVKS